MTYGGLPISARIGDGIQADPTNDDANSDGASASHPTDDVTVGSTIENTCLCDRLLHSTSTETGMALE